MIKSNLDGLLLILLYVHFIICHKKSNQQKGRGCHINDNSKQAVDYVKRL
ncbi:hypothetical protein LLDT2_00480 [Lactococcus lactis subsp. lactis bv. diacetylactis str. TIFN2]|nr:hypothetical protein LLDT2_00480 [Lactococcus lactis subsp. lactis bv. diacetylactis str. TIFN2]